MSNRTLIYAAIGLVVVIYLVTRKSSAAPGTPANPGGGGVNNAGVNADMGGADFGVTDPNTWD